VSAARHRCRRARERAGLDLGQAAHLLGVERDDLWDVEHATILPADALVVKMTEIYGVCAEWIIGAVPQRDYEAVRRMPGWEDLCFADRDEVAEFAASMPRRAP
jgi:ribosome-binding protein aMBF1 (putative translation factor)